MGTRIKPDYQPSERVYELLAPLLGTIEHAREFVGHELGQFKLYWEGRTDQGAAKANWDSTCLNWMKRQYEDKKESLARNRSFGKQHPDLFQTVAGDLLSQDMPAPPKPSPRYIHIEQTPIPGDGETMTEAEALEQLAKFRRGGAL